MKMLLLLLITVLFFGNVTPDVPEKSCTAITASKEYISYQSYDDESVISLDLKLFKFGNTTWIQVSNVQYFEHGESFPDYICANHPFYISEPDPQKCSPSLNTTFTFSLQEPNFYLHAHFPDHWYQIYSGYADDGTFSAGDGTLFSPQNPTFYNAYSDRKSETTEIQNCTLFVSAPEVTTKNSRCKSFESETIVYNSDNSIYANSTGIYNFVNGNNMTIAANFTGPKDYYLLFWANSQPCESLYKSCTFQLLKGDEKIIINSAIVKQNGIEVVGTSIPMIGRIIIRENQTLMKEGIPYSTSKNCLHTSFKFGDNQISKNQFCCTKFEDV